jgi:HK97 gp10 family phage protein
MAVTVKFEGGRELEAALRELPKATARNALNRGLKRVAEPVRQNWEQGAPRRTGKLAESVVVGKQLTRRQKADAKRDGNYFAEIHIGTSHRAGIPQEFGTVDHPAQPSGRPAWDSEKANVLDDFGKFLWEEIEKAAARRARKLAKG